MSLEAIVKLSRETEDALWKRWAQSPEDEGARGYLADYLAEAGSPLEPLVRKAQVSLWRREHGTNNLWVYHNGHPKVSTADMIHSFPHLDGILMHLRPKGAIKKGVSFYLSGAANHILKAELNLAEMKAMYRHLRDHHKTDERRQFIYPNTDPEPEVNVRRVELARKKSIPTPGQLFAAFRDVLKSPLMLARPPKNVEGGEYGYDEFGTRGDWQTAALAQEIFDEKHGPGHWLHWLARRMMKQKDEGEPVTTYHPERRFGVRRGLPSLSSKTPIVFAKQPRSPVMHPNASGLWAFYLDNLSSEKPVGRLFQITNNPERLGDMDDGTPIYGDNPKFKWHVGNSWSHPVHFDSHDDLDEWLRDAIGHAERHGHRFTLKTLRQMEAQIAAARNVPKE